MVPHLESLKIVWASYLKFRDQNHWISIECSIQVVQTFSSPTQLHGRMQGRTEVFSKSQASNNLQGIPAKGYHSFSLGLLSFLWEAQWWVSLNFVELRLGNNQLALMSSRVWSLHEYYPYFQWITIRSSRDLASTILPNDSFRALPMIHPWLHFQSTFQLLFLNLDPERLRRIYLGNFSHKRI